jgi:predicted nucleotidyltransferase
MKRARFVEILELLTDADVEFVLVGLLAGVLQGAPVTTFDVDIVYRRDPENVERLLRVLARLHAVYRGDPRGLTPQASHLVGPGHQLLFTDLGALDCLGTLDGVRGYEELLQSTTLIRLDSGRRVRVVTLEELIAIKRRAGRPKDLAAVPILLATLDELRGATRKPR